MKQHVGKFRHRGWIRSVHIVYGEYVSQHFQLPTLHFLLTQTKLHCFSERVVSRNFLKLKTCGLSKITWIYNFLVFGESDRLPFPSRKLGRDVFQRQGRHAFVVRRVELRQVLRSKKYFSATSSTRKPQARLSVKMYNLPPNGIGNGRNHTGKLMTFTPKSCR